MTDDEPVGDVADEPAASSEASSGGSSEASSGGSSEASSGGSSEASSGGSAVSASADESAVGAGETTDEAPARGGSRSVEVPMRLYKTVTVFATLIAMVAVILGFVALDVATNRARAAASDVNLVLAVVGLGSIVFGAFVYAFSTRFKAVGMGKSKDESDEEPDNG